VGKVCTLQPGGNGISTGNGCLYFFKFYFIAFMIKFEFEFEFEVAVICQINKLQLLPLGLCFTWFRDSPELTERLITVAAALAAGFTKTN